MQALSAFVKQADKGAYISIHGYLHPTATIDAALQALQTALRNTTQQATTLGYGPRFLHSTGQLHKGDSGKGLFIQFLADMPEDAPIPDAAAEDTSRMSFGTLKTAQALGDRQALLDNNRHVLRIDLGTDIVSALETLTTSLT